MKRNKNETPKYYNNTTYIVEHSDFSSGSLSVANVGSWAHFTSWLDEIIAYALLGCGRINNRFDDARANANSTARSFGCYRYLIVNRLHLPKKQLFVKNIFNKL